MDFYLVFGIILGLSAICLGFRDLRMGLLILILLLPLTHKETLSFYFLDITPPRIFLVGLAAGAFLGAVSKILKNRNLLLRWFRSLRKDRFFLLLFLLWLIRGLSLFHSLNLEASLRLLSFFSAVLAFYLMFRAVYKERGRVFLAEAERSFILGGVLTAAFAVIQFFLFVFKDYVILGIWPMEKGPPRIGATFWDVNHFAFFAASLALVFYGAYLSSSRWRVVFNFLVFVALVAILGLTSSQSGLALFLVGFLVSSFLLLLKGYAPRLLPVFIFIFLGVGAGFYFLRVSGFRFRQFIEVNFTPVNDSIAAHLYLAQGALEIFRKNPFLGGGYGSFNEHFRRTSLIGRYLKRDPVGETRIPAHSVWFEALSETGICGFLTFAALLLLPVIRSVGNIWKAKKGRFYIENAVFLGIILGTFVSGLVYSYNLLFFWFLIFLSLFLARDTLSKVPEGRFWPAFKRWFERNKDGLAICFLVVFSGGFIFWGLGRNALITWDESIYAGVSREMVGRRNFLTPHWNGEVFFEKPPLFFWLEAASFLYFGENGFAARFWSALFGIGGVVLVYLLGKRLFSRRVGFFSAIILATTVHWVAWSRVGMLDVPAATLILAAVYFFWQAWCVRKDPSFRKGRVFPWVLVGVFTGLTFMMKGPVAAIPIVVVLVFITATALSSFLLGSKAPPLIFNFQFSIFKKTSLSGIRKLRNWKLIENWSLRIGSLLFPFILSTISFLLIVFPWHYFMYRLYGRPFINEYFFYHILKRASEGIEQHGRPFWWFNIVIRHWARHWYVLGLVALVFLGGALANALRAALRKDGPCEPPIRREFQAELLIFLWVVLTFFIFSSSSSKIQWYIMPIYPVMAILCGWFVGKLQDWFSGVALIRCSGRGNSKSGIRNPKQILSTKFKIPNVSDLGFRISSLLGAPDFVLRIFGSRPTLTVLVSLSLLAIGVGGLLMNRRMWFPEDLNREVAFLSKAAGKLEGVGEKFYVADVAPGLPIFYSAKKVATSSGDGILDLLDKPEVVVLSKRETFQKILGKLEPGKVPFLRVFEATKDYVLFGRTTSVSL